MELDKLRKLEQEPPLSGAYMRSLVKQLAKDSMNPKDQNCVMNLSKHGKVVAQQQSTQLPQQQHKKQVRRRLHTSKPYQERLLNMAEARREIVTALKFHRAAMKEASEQQQQQQQQHHHHHHQQQQAYTPPLVPNSYTWHAASPIAQPHLMVENPNFILPNQTLGLNLNFHDFNNIDAAVHLNSTSSSSPSSYSSGTSNSSSQEFLPSVGKSQVEEGFPSVEFNAATQQVTGGLHTAMDDEAMADIRSLGDQYQMEWNDTMNLVKSACWFKFLKNMEHDGVPEVKGEDYAYRDFDPFLEFPTWLNANEGCLEQCSEDYFHDSTLPCMDIGDIDGMDDDWLA